MEHLLTDHPTAAELQACYNFIKNSSAWNQFITPGNKTVPSLTVSSGTNSLWGSERDNHALQSYVSDLVAVYRLNGGSWPDEIYDALDGIRTNIWVNLNGSGKPFNGVGEANDSDTIIRYQALCFGIFARYWLANYRVPPPPNEFTANEHKALKAFAGGLEATQEFVPDSWFSPDNQIETSKHDGGDETWKIPQSKKRRRRNLGVHVLEVVRKVPLMGRVLR